MINMNEGAYGEDQVRTLQMAFDDIDTLEAKCAELENKLEWRRFGDIHTCHDECKRPGCVLHRKMEWQAEMLERAEMQVLRLRIIAESAKPRMKITYGEAHDFLADLEKGSDDK